VYRVYRAILEERHGQLDFSARVPRPRYFRYRCAVHTEHTRPLLCNQQTATGCREGHSIARYSPSPILHRLGPGSLLENEHGKGALNGANGGAVQKSMREPHDRCKPFEGSRRTPDMTLSPCFPGLQLGRSWWLSIRFSPTQRPGLRPTLVST